jgi:DNA polymerase
LEGTTSPWTGKTGNFSYQNGWKRSKIYGGLFTENFVQSLARIIVGWQMLKIAERYRVVMMSHDEVVYIAKNREAKKAFEFGLDALKIAPSWCEDLPLNAEGYVGDFYCKT